MTKALTVLVLTLFLAACASQAQQVLNREGQAWIAADNRIQAECRQGRGLDEVKPAEALKLDECAAKVRNDLVLPVSAFPDLLIAFDKDARSLNKKYARKEISNAEWQNEGRQLGALYMQAREQRMASAASPVQKMNFLQKLGLVLMTASQGYNQQNAPLGGATYGQRVYSYDECVGPVIMGECKGTIVPNKAYHPTCHGTMINGQCTGPMF